MKSLIKMNIGKSCLKIGMGSNLMNLKRDLSDCLNHLDRGLISVSMELRIGY